MTDDSPTPLSYAQAAVCMWSLVETFMGHPVGRTHMGAEITHADLERVRMPPSGTVLAGTFEGVLVYANKDMK